jgi:hypothetical protein
MIDIEDNVPMPSDGWVSSDRPTQAKSKAMPSLLKPAVIAYSNPTKDNWVKDRFEAAFNPPKQPSATDCTFIGGPLNGQFGPIKGNDRKVVEIEIYNDDGSVRSVELYALNDTHPTPTFRVHVGTKDGDKIDIPPLY